MLRKKEDDLSHHYKSTNVAYRSIESFSNSAFHFRKMREGTKKEMINSEEEYNNLKEKKNRLEE